MLQGVWTVGQEFEAMRDDLLSRIAVMSAELVRQLSNIEARLYVVQQSLDAVQQDVGAIRTWLARRDDRAAPRRGIEEC